eukprot:gene11457-34167_t
MASSCMSMRGQISLAAASPRTSRIVVPKAGKKSELWTPSSQRGIDLRSKNLHEPIVCQGPGPNPLVVERFQGVVSQLFQQRIVRLGGAVDDDMANLLVAQLLYLDSADQNKDVTMYINSPGGSVTAGKRYSLPNSRIMIHQPLGGAQGQATDIEIQANEILHHKLTLNGYLAQFCHQSMSTITTASNFYLTPETDRDFFVSPQEAYR